MEIEIPLSEFESDHPNIGDFGEITLKVEVMEIGKEHICVLKHGPIKVTQPFKEIGLEDMKKQIGEVDDTEMPMKKDSENKESD
jgi:hypothetical protein